MKTRRHVRGPIQAVAGPVLALAVAAACSDNRSPIAPTAAGSTQALSAPSGAGAQTFLQGDPQLGPEIAAVRAATAQFHDVNAAIVAGYADPAGGICEYDRETGTGAMGIHSGNPTLLANPDIDPLRPEVLLYLPKPEGGFRLVGVEYVRFLFGSDPTGAPPIELFGRQFDGPMPGHFPGMPWHQELHVWIWANNPDGMFARWNPAISCSPVS
jgi:hypothetical protein